MVGRNYTDYLTIFSTWFAVDAITSSSMYASIQVRGILAWQFTSLFVEADVYSNIAPVGAGSQPTYNNQIFYGTLSACTDDGVPQVVTLKAGAATFSAACDGRTLYAFDQLADPETGVFGGTTSFPMQFNGLKISADGISTLPNPSPEPPGSLLAGFAMLALKSDATGATSVFADVSPAAFSDYLGVFACVQPAAGSGITQARVVCGSLVGTAADVSAGFAFAVYIGTAVGAAGSARLEVTVDGVTWRDMTADGAVATVATVAVGPSAPSASLVTPGVPGVVVDVVTVPTEAAVFSWPAVGTLAGTTWDFLSGQHVLVNHAGSWSLIAPSTSYAPNSAIVFGSSYEAVTDLVYTSGGVSGDLEFLYLQLSLTIPGYGNISPAGDWDGLDLALLIRVIP